MPPILNLTFDTCQLAIGAVLNDVSELTNFETRGTTFREPAELRAEKRPAPVSSSRVMDDGRVILPVTFSGRLQLARPSKR